MTMLTPVGTIWRTKLAFAYADRIRERDLALHVELWQSSLGEVDHTRASWITQPHTCRAMPGPGEWESDRDELWPDSSASKIFYALHDASAECVPEILVESGVEGVRRGVEDVVNGLMGPTTRRLDELGYSGSVESDHFDESLPASLARRNLEVGESLRARLFPAGENEALYCRAISDLKDLSHDLACLENEPGATLGFSGELGVRAPDLVSELDFVYSLREGWDDEAGDWKKVPCPPVNELFEKASWLRDGGGDGAIWDSFENVREGLSHSYSTESAGRLVESLFMPMRDSDRWVSPNREGSGCPRDLEFDFPSSDALVAYFWERRESGSVLARESLLSGDREGFDRAMDGFRQTCEQLRMAASGYLPSRLGVEAGNEFSLELLEKSDESAADDDRMAVYLVVSLSGWGERAGVPAWDGEMKGLFNQYYYDELLEVAPDGHVPHDWPWNSGSFRDLRYDDLVADPDFLQKFEEVTGGMLRGEQERMVRYISERVEVRGDPEDLYEGLLYRAGEPRPPG